MRPRLRLVLIALILSYLGYQIVWTSLSPHSPQRSSAYVRRVLNASRFLNIRSRYTRYPVCASSGFPMSADHHHHPHRTLRIIAAGLGRSGSTWQFNVLVQILRLAGLTPFTAHGQLLEMFERLNETIHCDVAVIKVHQFHPTLLQAADYVFTSHRDPRDTLISHIDLGTAGMWRDYWQEYLRWSAFACYDMNYESMWQDPVRQVQRTIDILNFTQQVNATQVLKLVEEGYAKATQKHNKSQWDRETAFFTKHIRDPEPGRWKKNATQYGEDLFRVESITREWMREHGYTAHFPVTFRLHSKSMTRLGVEYPPLASAASTIPLDQRCPLTFTARHNTSHLPAGTRVLPHIDYVDDICNTLPLYCDHFILWCIIVFSGCFLAFFLCFTVILRVLNWYFPPRSPAIDHQKPATT